MLCLNIILSRETTHHKHCCAGRGGHIVTQTFKLYILWIRSVQYSPVKLPEQTQPNVAGPHSPWFPQVIPDNSQSTLSKKLVLSVR